MNPIPILLRACRNSTKHARGHSWSAGIVFCKPDYPNDPFKPGSFFHPEIIPVERTEADDREAESWGGEFCSWDQALAQAKVGHSIDFYVRSLGENGELVTNVAVKIVAPNEAIVCDCGEKPFRVTL